MSLHYRFCAGYIDTAAAKADVDLSNYMIKICWVGGKRVFNETANSPPIRLLVGVSYAIGSLGLEYGVSSLVTILHIRRLQTTPQDALLHSQAENETGTMGLNLKEPAHGLGIPHLLLWLTTPRLSPLSFRNLSHARVSAYPFERKWSMPICLRCISTPRPPHDIQRLLTVPVEHLSFFTRPPPIHAMRTRVPPGLALSCPTTTSTYVPTASDSPTSHCDDEDDALPLGHTRLFPPTHSSDHRHAAPPLLMNSLIGME
ncbi:hypothetical protein R3P38DRAFT_3177708 [Favolaschia claudopus]|uniref:Uncharacterized protein n=1 Tax=Favolaschia claudopus TaxID=2862362 RepID=A0AAW0CU03_9AGAR